MIQSNILLMNLARNISAGFKMEVLSTMDVVMNNIADKENQASPMKKQRLMPQDPVLKVAKLSEHAIIPTRGSKQAAGYDLYSAYDAVVKAKDKAIVKTDIQIALPNHCYGRVAPRSGLAVKNFIDVGAGVIDQDYRGNVGVVLFNFGNDDFIVKRGDRIAQLICERIYTPNIEVLESLTNTERGSAGYGSTGKS